MKKTSRSVTLNNVTAQYVKLLEPAPTMDGKGLEYSCQLVLAKDAPQTAEVKKIIQDILKEAFPGEKITSAYKKGLRDADDEGKDEMAGCYFANVKRLERFGAPAIYSRRGVPLTAEQKTPDVLFSGCIVNAVCSIYSFSTSGNKGVAISLDGVQIVDNVNVQRMDGAPNLDAAFGALDDVEEEAVIAPAAEPVESEDIPW